MKDQLQNHVDSIARNLSNGFENQTNADNEPLSVYDFLSDVLDIEYIVSSNGDYRGARILVAFGGPNIWINTRECSIEGYWWTDKATAAYADTVGLDEALKELWELK